MGYLVSREDCENLLSGILAYGIEVEYDPDLVRFRDEAGKFVSNTLVEKLIQKRAKDMFGISK
ncbi:MAG: hypothetical protein AABY03_01610 [Nanoarchaeota archaeon]